MQKKDFRLYISLILYSLLPSIYLLIRMQIIPVKEVDINVMRQLEWFDLINKILVTTLTVPLYFLLKPEQSKNQNWSVFLVSFIVYALFIAIVVVLIGGIAKFMRSQHAMQYLFMQALSMLTGFVGIFMVMIFTLNSDDQLIRWLLIIRLFLQVLADSVLIYTFRDIGAVYAEIAVNILVGMIAMFLAASRGYLNGTKINKAFFKSWGKIGVFAGVRIFLENYIYVVMVCKMVNAVSQSNNYLVANNVILGWLFVPVICLVEVIKKNNLQNLTFKNCWKYIIAILSLWLITMPMWKKLIFGSMAEDDEMMKIVIPLIPFFVAYMVLAVIDGWFISKGKTVYNAINSLIVCLYYGIVYSLFKKGMFIADMRFIINMFGFGMVVHMLVSIVMWKRYGRKQAIQTGKTTLA